MTMKKLMAGLMVLAVSAMVAGTAKAELHLRPLQIGIGGMECQLVEEVHAIAPLRLNLIYSENVMMAGLDLGIAGQADSSYGIQANLVNFIDYWGVGIGAGFYLEAGNYAGVTVAPINYTKGTYAGLQMGFFSSADVLYGVQLGFINRVRELHGLQAGLLNISTESDCPYLPLVRVGF